MSRLASILAQELAAQRIFLSHEEEQALSRPVSYDQEEDLAWGRVRHRLKTYFLPELRNRFIRDCRPEAAWRSLIVSEEALAGEPTIITQAARQVLEWSATSSDRPHMMSGFLARALGALAMLFLALGAYAWMNGAQTPGAIVAIGGALFFLAGRAAGRFARRRASALAAYANSDPAAQSEAGTSATPETPPR